MPDPIYYGGGAVFDAGSPADALYRTWADAMAEYEARRKGPRSDVFGKTLEEDAPQNLSEELFTPVDVLADTMNERPSYNRYSGRSRPAASPWQTRQLPGGEIVQIGPGGELRNLKPPTPKVANEQVFEIPVQLDADGKPVSSVKWTAAQLRQNFEALPPAVRTSPIVKTIMGIQQSEPASELVPEARSFRTPFAFAGTPGGTNLFELPDPSLNVPQASVGEPRTTNAPVRPTQRRRPRIVGVR